MSKSNKNGKFDQTQLEELLYQALETEIGGIDIYTEAVKCAQNDDLRKEWKEYLEQTREHRRKIEGVLQELELDLEEETPGRKVVRHIGEALVGAMQMAKAAGDAGAAELVATECVVLAETKDHLNWSLLGEIAKQCSGKAPAALKEPCEVVEKEEDHHLYHTRGYCRELWLQSLGRPAVLPPPEEQKNVETAIGAARAKHARTDMLKGRKAS
jgi:rubrerythrin